MHFKYMKSTYADDFLNNGKMRVGTLYDFRRQELYNKEVADPNEGKKTVFTPLPGRYTRENMPPHLKSVADRMGHGTTFQDCIIEVGHDSPDYYIFCLTYEYSEKVMHEFHCDTALAIHDSKAFFKAISKQLSPFARFLTWDLCTYNQRHVHYTKDRGIPGAMMKEPKFSHQKEVRGIWEPRTPGAIKPVDIICPDVPALCSLHARSTRPA